MRSHIPGPWGKIKGLALEQLELKPSGRLAAVVSPPGWEQTPASSRVGPTVSSESPFHLVRKAPDELAQLVAFNEAWAPGWSQGGMVGRE